MQASLTNWAYGAFLVAVLVVAGVAEYLHIAPSQTFYTVFLIVVGLIVPSPVFGHTVVTTTPVATQDTLTPPVPQITVLDKSRG